MTLRRADGAVSLQNGMGFTTNQAILLSAPVSRIEPWLASGNRVLTVPKPYYYAVIPVLISSRVGDSKLLSNSVVIAG